MRDFRIRITLGGLEIVDDAAAASISENVLDGYLEACPESGPVVSADLHEHTLSIAFVVEAEDALSAGQAARLPFAEGAVAGGLDPKLVEIVGLEIEPVEAESGAEAERELIPA
jgi:hypothetical protein